MALDCAVALKENADIHLSKVTAALRANYMSLITCALVLLAAAALSYVMIKMAISTVNSYYALLPGKNKTAPARPKRKPAGAGAADGDDVVYASDGQGTASNLQDSDNTRIQTSMKRLEGKYAGYNAAMTEYAQRTLDRAPDDLMDSSILSRANDDFVYGRRDD